MRSTRCELRSSVPESATPSEAPGRQPPPFDGIHLPDSLKFDSFLAIVLEQTGVSPSPTRFVTPEDVLLAKLYWFRLGGQRQKSGRL